MHEMGQRFKCCSRKAPFVLTECEIAHGVCEDCEWSVGLREDHLLTFNEESETERQSWGGGGQLNIHAPRSPEWPALAGEITGLL